MNIQKHDSNAYESIDAMHDALNAMYKRGYNHANERFKAVDFRQLLNSKPVPANADIEELEDTLLLKIGEREFFSVIGNRLDFKENNPLGEAGDEFALGYHARARELLCLERDGYVMKNHNSDNFSERWEGK